MGNKEKIINAAMEIMYEKGISGTTLADISEKAGVSKGTLYYYYSAKDDLVFDIADRNMEQISTELLNWIGSIVEKESPEKILETVIHKITGADLRNRLHIYLIQEAITGSPELKTNFMNKYEHWRKLIVEGILKLIGDIDNYDVMAMILLTTLDGLVIQHTLGIKNLPVKEISSYLVKCIEKTV